MLIALFYCWPTEFNQDCFQGSYLLKHGLLISGNITKGKKQRQKQKPILPSQCPSTACKFSVRCRNVWVLFSYSIKDEEPESGDLVQVTTPAGISGMQWLCLIQRTVWGGTFSQCLCLIFILLPSCDILWGLEADDTDVPLRAEHSCSPHFEQLRVSVLTATCWREKYLWWWLSTANVIVTSGGVPSSSPLLRSSYTIFSLKTWPENQEFFPWCLFSVSSWVRKLWKFFMIF